MAVITYGDFGVGVDMSLTNVGGMFDYTHVSRSSTSIKLYEDAKNYLQFTGTKLTATTKNGQITDITSGTITGLKLVFENLTALSVTDANVSAEKLGDAISSGDNAQFLSLMLASNDTVNGTPYTDALLGLAGNDTLNGNDGDDVLVGGIGADKLVGGYGNDVIAGGSGVDKLIGDVGSDDLYGGSGGDKFRFANLWDSTVASAGRDTIFDFSGADGDRIDLSAIDARYGTPANQSFTFIGTAAFHGRAGELRYEKQASDTYVYADVNGDGKADFSIHLDDAVSLNVGHFIL